jgi:hypothetical protein
MNVKFRRKNPKRAFWLNGTNNQYLNLVKIQRDPLICSVDAPSEWRYVKISEEKTRGPPRRPTSV